jgi:hypothetical protein
MPDQRVYLSTTASSASQSFTISNPLGLTVSWTYPTLTGVSWATTNTGITLTAAQGTTLATTSVTVTAGYGAFSYPFIFSLNINPNILQNPGDVILYTLSNATLILKFTAPSSFLTPVKWTYPELPAGFTVSFDDSGITLTAFQGVSLGTSSVTITAICNGVSYSTTFNLTINNSFTFTTLNGATNIAPTTLAVYPSYPSNLSLISGIQYWTVPATSTYNFTVAGAGGTSGEGEKGAILLGSYTLSKNTILAICVGQMGGVVPPSGRSGSGGTFIGVNVQSINTTSLVTSVPLFIAGGAGGVGLNGGLQTASASLTTIGKNGYNGGSGRIGPNSGNNGTGYGGGGFNDFKNYGGAGNTGGAFGLGGAKGVNNASGGGGGGYGGGGGGGGNLGGSGGGGGLYDINNLFNCSVANSSQGYFRIDTGIRFYLSNVGSLFFLTSSDVSTFIPINYTTPNPYSLAPVYTLSPAISGLSVSSSLNGISLTLAKDTIQSTTSVTITPSYGTYSNAIIINIAGGPSLGFYIIPITRVLYTAYSSAYVNITTTNEYNLPVQWSLTPSVDNSIVTTTNTTLRLTYTGGAFAQKNMTTTVTYESTVYTQNFILQTNPTVLSLVPVYESGNTQRSISGVAVYNTTDSYLAFDTRGTFVRVFPNNVLYASPGDTITAIFNIATTLPSDASYRSVWIHNGSSWFYNPVIAFSTVSSAVGGTNITHIFTMPSLNPGLYSIIFMNSFFGQYTPSNVEYSDTGRTYAEFVLAVNDYSPKYVLSNPGTTTLNTITTQAGLSLTLTNPLNLTPIWSYPTIPGVSWATTPTSITLTAAQGTSYATNTITVQASYSVYSYPQSFSLTAFSNPQFVLSNPGATTLYTFSIQRQVILTLTNPLNLTPVWSYPTIPGVSWATTPTSITLTAAQGTSYATNTITVQASFLTFDYPQSFSLTIDNVTPVLNGVVTTFLTGLFYPQALVHDNTNTIYLSDTSNNLVKKVNATTAAFTTLYSGLTSGVAYDGSTYIYVTNYNTHNIYRINATTGAFITFAGTGSGGSANGTGTAASFSFPQGITYDSAGFLYVADTNNSTIRKITVPGAVVTTLAGLAGTTGSADGTGTAARFQFPYDVEYDGFGNVYVADSSNNTIRKIVVSTGVVTTFAGLAGTSGSADGIGTAARFNFPNGVTCDGNNKLVYVTDRNNQIIRQILVNNASVTTLAGLAGTSGDVNGTGSAARFYRPQGATVDKTTGTLFVLDTYNQKMKKIT